jgi:exopolysaccharide biosynthesis polyprenyl glycosylphosphotransferase
MRSASKVWILLDALTVLISAVVATSYEFHANPVSSAKRFWHGNLIQGGSVGRLIALMCFFILVLVVTSRRLHLYTPDRIGSFLHEQRLNTQACITAGLMLTGTIYLLHSANISRRIVLVTIGLTLVLLALRRAAYRFLLYQRFENGVGTRNVLIVGRGPEAQALRQQLENVRHLGYTFKGFVDPPASGSYRTDGYGDSQEAFDTLFELARKNFVDEIFFASHCDRAVLQTVLQKARDYRVDLRVIPNLYDGLAWGSPVEFVGRFLTIPLHRGEIPELALFAKRIFDIFFSIFTLLIGSPIMLAIALAIKLDSPGPVFYRSPRLGKKGIVFKCIKFRTMVMDAEQRRAELMHLNERDSILFKVKNDPRVTRLGGFLRKYSMDELPQFFNVLNGDMSVVGPRPPIASEVREYKLNHLRRLDVCPGITGLWQVHARQDPSFGSYISHDLTYIENWSIWLDIKIILRTIPAMLKGTGA